MDQQIIFRELLSEIQVLAKEHGGSLRRDEVDAFFGRAQLNKEQMELIYTYLQERHIRILTGGDEQEATAALQTGAAGTTEHGGPPQENSAGEENEKVEEPAGSRVLELYLGELSLLPQLSGKEEYALFQKAAAGDLAAKGKLVEAYLPMVCSMAAEYEDGPLPAEDLIQEGNLALLDEMEHLEAAESLAACRARLISRVGERLQEALQEAEADSQKDASMVQKVSRMADAIQALEEDLAGQVSAEELSAFLELPVEEIRNILRLTGE